MASGVYGAMLNNSLKGNIDFDTDTFYGMLVTSGYTPDFDTHDFRNDVTNEVSGTSYTAGGAVTTVTVSAYDTVNNRQELILGGFTLTTATITARGCAYYKRRGGASSADELVYFDDFGSDVSSVAGNFVVNASTVRYANP